MKNPPTLTDDGLVTELRVEIVRLRAALAEAMDYWSGDPPPADVIARCEAALGIADEMPAAYSEASGSPSGRIGLPDPAEPALETR